METKRFDTGMYVIDQDYRILTCNQEMRAMYPEVKPGDLCYKAVAMQDAPCATCPLYHNDVLFFNPVRGQWVSANAAHMDYPGHGLCYSIQFRVRNNVGGTKREIIHLEKIDEYLAELNASSGDECVIGAYYEEATPIFFANEHMVHLLGYQTIDEVMDATGGMGANILHPDDRERVKNDLVECTKEGDTFETTFRLAQHDGNWLWVILKGRMVKTESGQMATLSVCNSMEHFLNVHDALEKEHRDLVQELEQSRQASATRDELLAIASKEQILSEITKKLYSYNLTLNLNTGRYSLIVGTGLENYVDFFQATDDYLDAYEYNIDSVDPDYWQAFAALTSLESLRAMRGRQGIVGTLQYPVNTDGVTAWQEMNVFISTNEFGEDIANLLCRDVTEAHISQEKKENELRAIASKDQILSEITQTLYSYNLTLNLKTGRYSLIVGTGLENYVEFFRTSDDYVKAYYFSLANTDPEYRRPFEELTNLEKLRSMAGKKGFIGSLEYSANLNGGFEWHEMNVFIGTNEFGEDIANLLCRDVTEAHYRQQIKENELRASVSKDQILSEITKMLYSYNLTLNLKTGRYSLIVGTGMENFIGIFQSTDDYSKAFNKKMTYVDPKWADAVRKLASLKNLRRMSDRKGFVQSLEYAVNLGGKTEWHEMNVFMGNNEMGEDIANILGRDITEAHERTNTKNQLEIAQASNDAKTRFLSNMSHDIRTPINGIMGMLHIAQTHRDDPGRVDDCLNKIEISTNYLLTLLNDILDLNKLESGKAVAERDPFNMNDLLNDIYNIIQPTAHMTGVQLEKTCGIFNHPDVIGSPLHLRQILMNLISNAIKYSKENGTAFIRVDELAEENGMVRYRFQVEDNGIGMSEEFQQKMFDMFEQEYSGARTIHKGSGLGLAIVKMLVDLLGGELSVRSAKDAGSTFTVILPFQINREPVVSARETFVANPDCLRDAHILIVEDNDFNMEIAQVILEEAGAVTTPAENGKIAVDMFANSHPGTYDVILMDIMMPEMDGLEATRIIRQMDHPDAKSIPIIAMTANAFSEDIQKSLDAGMNEHIAKPLDMSALAVVIAKAARR